MTGELAITVIVTAAGTLLATMLWEPLKGGISRLRSRFPTGARLPEETWTLTRLDENRWVLKLVAPIYAYAVVPMHNFDTDRRPKFERDPFESPLDMNPGDTVVVSEIEVGEQLELRWVEYPPQLLLWPRTRRWAQMSMRRDEKILVQ